MQEEQRNNEMPSHETNEENTKIALFESTQISESAETETDAPAPSFSWSFGDRLKTVTNEEDHSSKSFIPVFLGVIAVCLALLVLLLFIGDAGIKVYREVHTEHTIYVREDGTVTGLLSPNEAAALAAKSTVTIVASSDTAQSLGSGFVYAADGYIVTNYHTVRGMDKFQIILPSGEAVDAILHGGEPYADLAVLKVDQTDLEPIGMGSSSALTVGDDVIAIGTPASLEHQQTATFGNVSALGRLVIIDDGLGNITHRIKAIQTDTEINPGNSGGPLIDRNGKVVGINTRRLLNYNGNTYIGIGYAIPIDEAKIVIDALIKEGKFTGENPVASGKCVLGITGRGLEGGYWYSDLQAETVERSPTEKEGYVYNEFDGVYVSAVSGSNVIGKLEVGDMITRINGLCVYTVQDIIGLINCYPAYSEITLTVMRKVNGSYSEMIVKVRLDVAALP